MHVHGPMHTGFIHGVADGQHFGAALRGRFGPFAVQVDAQIIGPQMPTATAIRIAIGHNVKATFFKQHACMRIAQVGEHIDGAFHPIFGLSLAGMLARIEPDLRIAIAHFEAIDGLTLDAVAKAAIGHALKRCCLGNQVMVTFHVIGREIGKPCKIACGGVTDGQSAAVRGLVISGISAAPIIAVFGDASAVIRPATWIGAALQSGNPQFQLFAC